MTVKLAGLHNHLHNPAWLAQLVRRRSAELEATGLNLGQTNTQAV